MTQLEKICKSFRRYYEKKRKDNTFVMIIPFGMQKSNIWVSLLVYPWLRDMLDDIQFRVTDAYNEYVAEKKRKNGVVCIICDDCAYTGNQLMSYSSLSPTKTHYANKPKEPDPTSAEWLEWNKTIREETEVLEKVVDRKIFSVNLVIPYMSTMAQQNIINHHYLMIPRDIKVFKLFRERVNMHEYNHGVVREFESSFQYHTNISSIYFDHKIADAVSTFNKVFLLAPIFNCGSLKKSLCFIENCCQKEKSIPEDINIYDSYVNLEDTLDGKVCPQTFYKSIKYTFDKKSVTDRSVCTVVSGSKLSIIGNGC
jgi:hypothetical protein